MINVLIMLCSSVIVLGAFLGGLYVGVKLHRQDSKQPLNCNHSEVKPIVELTEEQAKELKRRQIELQNFLNYNGDVMPDPKEKLYDK